MQVKHVLGLEVPRFSGAFKIIYTYTEIFKNIKHANVPVVVISVICITALLVVKLIIDPRCVLLQYKSYNMHLFIVKQSFLMFFSHIFVKKHIAKVVWT